MKISTDLFRMPGHLHPPCSMQATKTIFQTSTEISFTDQTRAVNNLVIVLRSFFHVVLWYRTIDNSVFHTPYRISRALTGGTPHHFAFSVSTTHPSEYPPTHPLKHPRHALRALTLQRWTGGHSVASSTKCCLVRCPSETRLTLRSTKFTSISPPRSWDSARDSALDPRTCSRVCLTRTRPRG